MDGWVEGSMGGCGGVIKDRGLVRVGGKGVRVRAEIVERWVNGRGEVSGWCDDGIGWAG